MLKHCFDKGLTKAGNMKHPTRPDCVNWVHKSWANLDPQIILNTVKNCYMLPDPGPVVEGYDEQEKERVDDLEISDDELDENEY